MTPEQRDRFALRMVQTWPKGPGQSIWAETVAELDYPACEQAYALLRREDERPPSCARFLAAYRTFDKPTSWARPVAGGPPLSFDEYIDKLHAKADAGDHDAEANLDIWADNESRGLTKLIANVIQPMPDGFLDDDGAF